MKSARSALALLALPLLFWATCGKKDEVQASRDRRARRPLLSAASVESVNARYVFASAQYPQNPNPTPALLLETLTARHWISPADTQGLPLAWCEATQKGAFFRHGWIWICDKGGRVLKSVWFEPDLKADGKLEFSDDGTQLRLRADGWRHWLNLDLGLSALEPKATSPGASTAAAMSR